MESAPQDYTLAWVKMTFDPWIAETIVNWCTNKPIGIRPDLPSRYRQHELINRLDEVDPWRANTAFTVASRFIEMQEKPPATPDIGALDI
jgi:hypothetical protein